MKHALVIGAGLGGLAAAIGLAARGWRVTVVDFAPRPGGKAGIETVDGVTFDTGPSVLTLPELVDATFRSAGTSLREEVGIRELSPGFRYMYADGLTLDVHHDLSRTLAEVRAKLGPKAEAELADFLAHAGRIWDTAAPYFVLDEAPTPWTLVGAGPARWVDFLRVDPLRSMSSAIRARVRDPHLRALLLRYATYNGSDPRVAPGTLNCIAHVELSLGGYGVEGGVYSLVEALVRVGERLGVAMWLGVGVERVRVEGGVARGVVLRGGERVDADVVIANADVAHLAGELLPASTDHGLAPVKTPSTSGWTGVARARRQADRAPHTVIFPERYEAEFEDLFDHRRPPQRPTVYLCAQEACHGRAGWAEEEPVFLMANAPAESAEAASKDELWMELRERVLLRAREAGALEAGDALVWERDPRGLAQRFPGSRGALYGAASNSPFAAFQRPANRNPRVRGLYLASGSAHPGGGMPLCVQSGRLAAQAAHRDHGV